MAGTTTLDPQQSAEETPPIELDVILTPEQLAFLEPLENALSDYDLRVAFPYLTSEAFAEICRALPKEYENTYKVDERGAWQLSYFQRDSADDADYRIALLTDRDDGQVFLADSHKFDGRFDGTYLRTRDVINGRESSTDYNGVRLDVLLTEEQLAYVKLMEDAMLSLDIEAAHNLMGIPEFKDFFLALAEDFQWDGIYRTDDMGEWTIRYNYTVTDINTGDAVESAVCDINFSILLTTDYAKGLQHRIQTSWTLLFNYPETTGSGSQPRSFYIHTTEVVDGLSSDTPLESVSKELLPSGWVTTYN